MLRCYGFEKCRHWRRERTPAARAAFCAKRLQFHHLVRRKKAQFWNTWLHTQERLAHENPRVAAQNICQQMGIRQRTLPSVMRSPESNGGHVEGPSCLDAWRTHFRNVPRSAQPAAFNPSGPSLPVLPDVVATKPEKKKATFFPKNSILIRRPPK